MDDNDFVWLFKKECKYYDKENRELKAILSLIDLKQNNKLLDIGAGIGRLSIPLSKYVNVSAIDNNKLLLNEIKNPNIEKIEKKIEDYYPKEKFDYGLIVWPGFQNFDRVFRHIKKNVIKNNGKLIILKSKEHDCRKITKKLFPELFDTKKPSFMKVLPKYFKIEKEKIIKTREIFPNLQEALKILIFEIFAFYNKKINKKQKQIILDFLKEREQLGKVYLKTKMRVLLCTKKSN